MGMIGQSAISPLTDFMINNVHSEFSRAIATDGLCEIAKNNHELRDNILIHFQKYLKNPDTSVKTFNGLLISALLDLDAKEMIDEICDLFKQQCVDLSIVGDIEDVEIELRLRTQRDTPKPTFEEIYGFPPPLELPKPESDDVFGIVDYYLDLYGHDNSILDTSELDGFFVALACYPQMIMPSIWMPAIWAGEELCPEWESEKELMNFNTAVMVFYDYAMQSMNAHDHEALFLYHEVDQKTYTIVDEWCEGFLRGINLWQPISSSDAIVLEKALEPIRLFATEHGFEKLEKMTEEEIEKNQNKIESVTFDLFDHFFQQRKELTAPVIRSEPKIGRNEPCPCGSGKKFKKCCLH